VPQDNLLGQLLGLPGQIAQGMYDDARDDVRGFVRGINPGYTGAGIGAGLAQAGIEGGKALVRGITGGKYAKTAADILPKMARSKGVMQTLGNAGKLVGDTAKFAGNQIGRIGPAAQIIAGEILNPRPADLSRDYEKMMFGITEPLVKWQAEYAKRGKESDPEFEKLHNLMQPMKKLRIGDGVVDRATLNTIYQALYNDPSMDIRSFMEDAFVEKKPGFNAGKLQDWQRVFNNPDELEQRRITLPLLKSQRSNEEMGMQLDPSRYADMPQIAPTYSQVDSVRDLMAMSGARGRGNTLTQRIPNRFAQTPGGLNAAQKAVYGKPVAASGGKPNSFKKAVRAFKKNF
jgi:hypothetical protein